MTIVSPPLTSSDSPGLLYLHQDILWLIFTFCAIMHPQSDNQTPAVDTLRYASQVSSSWRNLLLSSPSLWGRVINLTRLEQSPEWLEEVMKRTGDSWLYVRAAPDGEMRDLRFEDDFVRSFVTHHWKRIRWLDLKLALEFAPMTEARNWHRLLNSPSNLRYLKAYSIILAFDLFPTQSPQLECLELEDDDQSMMHIRREDDLSTSPSPIRLPRLKCIKIKSCNLSTSGMLLTVLNRVVPADDCLLNFYSPSAMPIFCNLDSSAVPLILPKYLGYAKKTLAAATEGVNALFVMTTFRLDFVVSLSPFFSEWPDDDKDDNVAFRCGFEWCDDNLRPASQLIPDFISALKSVQVKEVKALTLVISGERDQADLRKTIVEHLFQAFRSIEYLILDRKTFYSLDVLEGSTDFGSIPTLEDIILCGCDPLAPEDLARLPLRLGGSHATRVHMCPDMAAVQNFSSN
ncbi:hypothetical protein CVT26_004464 [Gymnopilus dilepis]|uniref:F-box domain-containing protein n=1 Tax=Gymnopilus dilepis TaxID=231916 RepID=A0A409WDY5_9AGAR|nr:hypothetical protein CVT26_004464 [Gymnopilus dilepis]